MAEHKGQNYLHGAAILTLGVIIMKVLGFFYKIPLGNILGDEGYSMFMGAYSIYNIFFTLATAGLPVALSRLVAEADAHGRARQEEKTFRVALLSFTVLGLIFGAILLFFPNWLAAVYLENPDAGPSVRAMAPAILLVCMVSAYRGYCQGNGNMLPTTVDEVLEVFFKVVSGLVIAILVMRRFHGDPRALPLGSAGAIFGVSIGSTISLLYMVFYKRRNYDRLAAPYTGGRSLDDVPDDDVLVDPANLPAAFITPLTISIVPAISGAIARKDRRSAAKVSEDSMRISAVIAVPMGVGLAVLAEPIMHVLYPGSHLSGPRLLAVMGIASFFVCLVLMENAILQASGKEKLTMMTLILGGLVKIAVNWFLVAQRSINIHGAPIGTLASYCVMAVLDYVFLCRTLSYRPKLNTILLKPVVGSALMGAAAWGSYGVLDYLLPIHGRLHTLVCMFLAIVLAVAVYLILTITMRMITKEDMALIPGGDKIAGLLRMQ